MSPPPPKFRRLQSQTERDMDGMAEKRRREAVPVELAADEDSMAHDVNERKTIRGKRDTGDRFEKLETFKDEAIEDLTAIKVSIARVEGEQKAQTVSLRAIEKHLENAQHRERVEHAATVDVETAEKKDAIDARKGKRDLYLKIAGAVLGGGLLGKLLAMAGIL
jgi:hypothetical protein